jgi:hypothetical protein
MKAFLFFSLILIYSFSSIFAQVKKSEWTVGLYYGFGSELMHSDYSYNNNYFKAQLSYTLKETKNFKYEIVLQPELNFASHQLLNLSFVGADEPDYLGKREQYGRLKNIKEYVLGIGLIIRKPISKNFSLYLMGSVGPMITDTETERLSKGFAFADVVSLGFSFKRKKMSFDLRPNFRHVSNANLQKVNAGINTINMEFGCTIAL